MGASCPWCAVASLPRTRRRPSSSSTSSPVPLSQLSPLTPYPSPTSPPAPSAAAMDSDDHSDALMGPDAWAPRSASSSDDEEAALEVVALGRLPPGRVLQEAIHDAELVAAKTAAISLPWTFLDSLVTDVPAGATLAGRLADARAGVAPGGGRSSPPPPEAAPRRGAPPPPPPPVTTAAALVDDDVAREASFAATATAAAESGLAKLRASGVRYRRPADYFAQMVKADGHMAKVKSRMLAEQARIDAAVQRRHNREAGRHKRAARAAQVEVEQARAKGARDTIAAVEALRKGRLAGKVGGGGDAAAGAAEAAAAGGGRAPDGSKAAAKAKAAAKEARAARKKGIRYGGWGEGMEDGVGVDEDFPVELLDFEELGTDRKFVPAGGAKRGGKGGAGGAGGSRSGTAGRSTSGTHRGYQYEGEDGGGGVRGPGVKRPLGKKKPTGWAKKRLGKAKRKQAAGQKK